MCIQPSPVIAREHIRPRQSHTHLANQVSAIATLYRTGPRPIALIVIGSDVFCIDRPRSVDVQTSTCRTINGQVIDSYIINPIDDGDGDWKAGIIANGCIPAYTAPAPLQGQWVNSPANKAASE